MLKRPDESKLVRLAHLNTRFVEDCVRIIAINLVKKYPDTPVENKVVVSVENQESVHAYNAYAEINSTFGEIIRQNQKI